MRTSTVSCRLMKPSPWQFWQVFRSRPVPPQRGQVRLNFMAPAICVTWPEPSHSGQTATLPPDDPVPWQTSQVS